MSCVIIIFTLKRRGYRHRDQDFKNLLKKVDGLRYAPGFDDRSTVLIYQCQQCHMFYFRKNKSIQNGIAVESVKAS